MAEEKEPVVTTQEPSQELKVVEQQYQISSFANKDSFEHVQRVASVFSKSELVPKKYQGNIANCVIALEMAGRMNVSPLMVMQNLDIIMGRPCWSSQFLIASLNACGRFSPLRYEDGKENGGRMRAWATDKKTGEKLFGVWVSMEMAKAEGWIDKAGSKWKTMPELMMRYRAASFFTKQYAPEISMGFQTAEEVQDITYNADHEANAEDLKALFDQKYDLLDAKEIINIRRIIDEKEVDSYRKAINLLNEAKPKAK